MVVGFLLSVCVVMVRRSEREGNSLSIADDVCCEISLTSLKTLVSVVLESESRSVPSRSLLGVAHPEVQVIVASESAASWSLAYRFLRVFLYFSHVCMCISWQF